MSFYSDGACPVSHAVRFVLAEKAINVEIHNIAKDERPEDLIALNPYNSILTLVDRELVLYEPQIIMEYLDERFPHPPLMPVDPVARANNRQYRYRFGRDTYSIITDITQGSPEEAALARKKLRDQLIAISSILVQTSYFMSEEYSLVDCYFVRQDLKVFSQGLRWLVWRVRIGKVEIEKEVPVAVIFDPLHDPFPVVDRFGTTVSS